MDLKTKEITIPITMSAHEWCRLMFMAEHIGEEAHESGDEDEPWFQEKWWNDYARMIEKVLKEHEVTECDMHSYDKENTNKNKPLWIGYWE